jgi:anti-sigma regulatory factor (Ser/Thr protein kinase)/CheY-like chemotaxis protein
LNPTIGGNWSDIVGRILIIGHSNELAHAFRREAALHAHEIETCEGAVEALQRLQSRAVDVVVTDPETSVREDLALCALLRERRPGVRIIALAPAVSPDAVIAALRAHVFACFARPFEIREIADMVSAALRADQWSDGIEVVSGAPHWLTLRVSCRLLTADRLVRFMTELQAGVVDDDRERDLLMTAFREVLLNAMEHGGGFDPEQVIEVTAARTARAIVYHFRDPGLGFDQAALAHATGSSEPEAVIATAIHRAEAGLRPGGFGMLIVRQVVDEVTYNERGNEVLLIKHLS